MVIRATIPFLALVSWLAILRSSCFVHRNIPFRPVRRESRRLMSDDVVFVVIPSDGDGDDDGDSDAEGSNQEVEAIVFLEAPSDALHVDIDHSEDEEEEETEPEIVDPYQTMAASEFLDDKKKGETSSIVSASSSSALATPTTKVDWGGALGKLRQRVEDIESGKSQDPSHSLFRLMSSQSPSQQVSSFVSTAKPSVVTAMSSAISSLLGGLAATPVSGFDTVVKASSEKLGSLCFQLQMTGYMFRNAEYVMALKQLMKIKGSATLEDYKEAFDEIDSDGSGFIDSDEIRSLLDRVYDGRVPGFEVEAFLKFFDSNKDGRISWEEFERGLGRAMAQKNQANKNLRLLGFGSPDDDDDDVPDLQPMLEGTVEVELEDGKVIEIEANEYVNSLKQEVRALKASLRREKGLPDIVPSPLPGMKLEMPGETYGGITDYIARRQGDLKSLTEGISPEIVTTMKLLVDFVLDGGDSGKARKEKGMEGLELELPASALQQLAFWQLVLGYRLREAEAKGDYLKLLD